MSDATFANGIVIADRYRLADRIAAGGMGSVWRATHVTLGHDVAIKFLQVHQITDAARARFVREAKLAARLGEASRHIARVIDYGVYRETRPYLVMELLHGETLGARVRREKQLPLDVTAGLIAQLCRALQVAHGAGVIHRDLKPSNIFLASTEFDDVLLKLLDFGVAKSTIECDDDDETTCEGTLIGTPGYMSPEQILAKRPDARTDLWAVGAIVYRLTTGRAPFGHGGAAELGLRILATDPPMPSTIAPNLPAALDDWMAKALAKSAEERFQSARDLSDALSSIVGVRHEAPTLIGPIVPLPDETPIRISFSSVRPSEIVTQKERPPRERRRLAPALTMIGILAAGIVIEHARASGSAPPQPASATEQPAPASATPASSTSPASPASMEAKPSPSAAPPPSVSASVPVKPRPSYRPVKRVVPERPTTWTRKDDL